MVLVSLSPSLVMYFSWVFAGISGAVMSGSLIGIWLWLEVGFAGVICLFSATTEEENEAAMKYFIFQSISGLLIFFTACSVGSSVVFVEWGGSVFGYLGVAMKLGIFPFHIWVAPVMGFLSWKNCFFVAWSQKVGPLWMLSCAGIPSWIQAGFELSALLTAVVGCVGGFGVNNYRVLVAYSSLVQSGWLVVISLWSQDLLKTYMTVYGITFLFVVHMFDKVNVYKVEDLAKIPKKSNCSDWENSLGQVEMIIHLSSLGGMPPFLGGALKIVSSFVLWEKAPLACVVLLGCSTVSLFFYFGVIGDWAQQAGMSVDGAVNFIINTFKNGGCCPEGCCPFKFYEVISWFMYIGQVGGAVGLMLYMGIF